MTSAAVRLSTISAAMLCLAALRKASGAFKQSAPSMTHQNVLASCINTLVSMGKQCHEQRDQA